MLLSKNCSFYFVCFFFGDLFFYLSVRLIVGICDVGRIFFDESYVRVVDVFFFWGFDDRSVNYFFGGVKIDSSFVFGFFVIGD